MKEEKDQYFKILPQHKNYMRARLSAYLTTGDITKEDLDESQKGVNLIEISFKQSELLRRTLLFNKICKPILSELPKHDAEIKKFYNYSWGRSYLSQAEESFRHGLILATIILCRSALEIGIREVISHIKEVKDGTSFLDEYSSLEWESLSGLIIKAMDICLLKEGELEDVIYSYLPFLHKYPFIYEINIQNNRKIKKLLDKFVHGSFSDLFIIIQELKIDGKKTGSLEEYLEKSLQEHKDLDVFSRELLSRWFYASQVLSEELALYFLQITFEMFKRIYFERSPNLIHVP